MERLYKWERVSLASKTSGEKGFIEEEMKLNQYGIRTRVILNEVHLPELWVPMKDIEVANALIHDEVTDIVDEPKDLYHVFDSTLKFKNKRLYENRFPINIKFTAIRRYSWFGILVLILLILFRFIRF